MASGVRGGVSHKYSGRTTGKDEIDTALDDLPSFSYLDGIPFELDRGIRSALETARAHIAKADALIAAPLPVSITQPSDDDILLADIGRVEKQVR